MIGGNIYVDPEVDFSAGKEKPRIRIRIDGISESYGVKDPRPAFKSVLKWANAEFNVISHQWGTYPSYALYYSLIIEDKLP
jgi:hypothetical protein